MAKKKQKFNFKIKKIYEKNNSLVIETESPYGEDVICLSRHKRFLDPLTNKPKYLEEVKRHLKNKYMQEKVTQKDVDTDLWGTEDEVVDDEVEDLVEYNYVNSNNKSNNDAE